MSRRREIAQRLEALSDIAGILSAMKGLALMEIRILSDFLLSQRRLVAGIEATAVDFLAWHSELLSASDSESKSESESESGVRRELCILIGSEQGFCGDFNEALLAHLEALSAHHEAPLRWVVVGRRLASRLGERDAIELVVPGAVVADEVPTVLLRLTRELSRLLPRSERATDGLSTLYHADASGELRLRRLLPLRDLPSAEREYPYPPELNLTPDEFLRGLTGHYLYAALNEVLYSSLMAENHQRQAHMDRALQRLDEDSARLRITYNTQRQEEITEEIELILLSADLLSHAEAEH